MKKFFVFLLAVGMLLTVTACGSGNEWPNKTIEFVTPYSAGGDSDTYLRAAADIIGKDLDTNTIVTNMTTGYAAALNYGKDAKADGYTVLYYNTNTNGNFANGEIGFMPDEMISLGSIVYDETYALVGRANENYETLDDIQQLLQDDPKSLRIATTERTLIQVLVDSIEDALEVDFEEVNVGEDNSTRLIAILNGEADLMLGNYANFTEYIADGQMVCFGLLSAERNPGLPDVPTLREQGADVTIQKYYEFRVPAGTPDDVVEKLSASLEKVTQDESFIALAEQYSAYAQYTDGKTQDELDMADIENQIPYYQ